MERNEDAANDEKSAGSESDEEPEASTHTGSSKMQKRTKQRLRDNTKQSQHISATEKAEVGFGSDPVSENAARRSRNRKRTRHVLISDGIISISPFSPESAANRAVSFIDDKDVSAKPIGQSKGKESGRKVGKKLPSPG